MKFLLLVFVIGFISCNNNSDSTNTSKEKNSSSTDTTTSTQKMADVATILSRPEVPILCYHHIRTGHASLISYQVSPDKFAEQMKALNDSGFHSILPDQLYDYLVYGKELPSKPFMITFDDTDLEQFTIAKTEMDKYGFKGVYFIMTISINRPRYMSREQIKQLSDEGHVIAAHTWDHHMVTKYTGNDWDTQMVKPRKKLEEITGKKISYFAYPFGLWNLAAIDELKKRDYKMAFILSSKRDSTEPLHTIRRMIVPGTWSTPGMIKSMRTTFD